MCQERGHCCRGKNGPGCAYLHMIIIVDEKYGIRQERVHKVGGSFLPLPVTFLSRGKCHEEVKKKLIGEDNQYE